MLYIGTHGRGIFKSGDLLTSRKDNARVYKNNVMLAYPNPAKDFINLNFNLESATDVTIHVFDLSGRAVETIPMNRQNAGNVNVNINTQQYRRGAYIARLQAGSASSSVKFIVTD